MAFLHLPFDNFEFRDLGHSDFLSFKVLAPTQRMKRILRGKICQGATDVMINSRSGTLGIVIGCVWDFLLNR